MLHLFQNPDFTKPEELNSLINIAPPKILTLMHIRTFGRDEGFNLYGTRSGR